MSDSEEINVEFMDDDETNITAASKLKRQINRSGKKRKRKVKLALYQSRTDKSLLAKRQRRSTMKQNSKSANYSQVDEPLPEQADMSYCINPDTSIGSGGYIPEDSIETIPYCFDNDHDVTDACMSAISFSFEINEPKKDDSTKLQSANNATSDKNVQTSGKVLFEDEFDLENTTDVSFKERCIRKLTNKDNITQLVNKLDDNDCLHDFVQLITVLISGKLPIKNIPLLLLLDLAKFVSLKNTSGMYYREQTKRFWSAIYKFGGGAMLRFLSGLKNFAQVCLDKCKKGHYDPSASDVNFAVPDLKSVRTKDQKKIPPGFIQENIDKVDRTKQYNLAVDGKKVGPGCTGLCEGDINLFGFEGPPTLNQQINRFQNEIGIIEDIINGESEDDFDYSNQVDKLPLLLRITSKRVKDMRITQVNNERLRNSFQKSMAKDPNQYKKYNFGISSINIYQFFSDALINKILYCNKEICYIMSKIQQTHHLFNNSSDIQLENQGNACVLLPPEMITLPDDEELVPQFIKQGTEEWLSQRKLSYITGSTMYKGK